MRALFVVLAITAATTGCTTLNPATVTAKTRLYNGRNGGETQSQQSITGNTINLTIATDLNPEAAKNLGAGLSGMFRNQSGAGEVNQHFTGGGVQAAGSEKGGFWSWLSGRKSKSKAGDSESTIENTPIPQAVATPEEKPKP